MRNDYIKDEPGTHRILLRIKKRYLASLESCSLFVLVMLILILCLMVPSHLCCCVRIFHWSAMCLHRLMQFGWRSLHLPKARESDMILTEAILLDPRVKNESYEFQNKSECLCSIGSQCGHLLESSSSVLSDRVQISPARQKCAICAQPGPLRRCETF